MDTPECLLEAIESLMNPREFLPDAAELLIEVGFQVGSIARSPFLQFSLQRELFAPMIANTTEPSTWRAGTLAVRNTPSRTQRSSNLRSLFAADPRRSRTETDSLYDPGDSRETSRPMLRMRTARFPSKI